MASVSDNCSQNLIAQGVVGQESGAGCSLQIPRWTVTDGCGNVGVQSQTVSYTRDTELPVITLAAAGALTCNPTAAEIEAAFGAASVSDNCSQNLIAQGVVGQESGAGCVVPDDQELDRDGRLRQRRRSVADGQLHP